MNKRNFLCVGVNVSILAAAARAAPPSPDHVVIVIEENHAYGQIIGSASAPYMNSLAQAGASFTNFYGLTHPSQPNYLQWFSGANQGVTDNTVPPAGAPFSTPNLGAELIAAGRTFFGYSEDLPSLGSTINSSGTGGYFRKHNPWVDWQSASPGTNQLPIAVNRPFFSADIPPLRWFGDVGTNAAFSQLPTVCVVVPNQNNDMHDGTIAQADTWLMTNIKPYADWAATHNSLLIVTWDEDDSSANNRNRIATIFYGPMMTVGQNASTWTLHHLLRTIEDMYGTTHAGSAANASSIAGVFTTDPATATTSFRQGVAAYSSAHDTFIEQANPNTTHGVDATLVTTGSSASQGLIRFDNIIGSSAGQVPQGAIILSAKLLLLTGPSSATGDSTANTISLYRMIAGFSDSSSWNSLGGGVSTNGIEAAATADYAVIPNVLNNWAIFDVTRGVQAWADTPATNAGWLVQSSGSDPWRWLSSETATSTDRPLLEVTYAPCLINISQQPTGQNVLIGNSLSLSVTAAGAATLTYQWRRNSTPLIDSGSVSGATTAMLTINPAVAADTGGYDVLIGNGCGSAASNVVSVLVCPATPNGDMNGNGATDGTDIQPFVTALLAASSAPVDLCRGDYSHNGFIDAADAGPFAAALLGP